MSCAKVAAAADVPKTFAHKILKKMVNAGIVESRNGRNGGFRLAKSPKEICLNDVVETIQGATTVSKCVIDPNACELATDCPVSSEWCKLQDMIVSFFNQTTLHSILVAHEQNGTAS